MVHQDLPPEFCRRMRSGRIQAADSACRAEGMSREGEPQEEQGEFDLRERMIIKNYA